jgi:hypothetical protein
MTESEWLECTDMRSMIGFLHDKASDRKMRLFACACCRRIWSLLADKRCRKAVTISEQYADGMATDTTLDRALHAAWQAACKSSSGKTARERSGLNGHTWEAIRAAAANDGMLRSFVVTAANAVAEATIEHDRFDPCFILRDIFDGMVFPVAVNDSWLTWNEGIVLKLVSVR